MKIEKIEFGRMVGEFQHLLNLRPPTSSFSGAVEEVLEEYLVQKAVVKEKFGAHKCDQLENNCIEYLRELKENGYAKWASGPLRDFEWLDDTGELYNPIK